MQKRLYVGGMTCTACSQGIEKAVKKLDGIKTASVSLMAKTLDVEFDDSILTVDKIIRAVESLGYTASAEEKKSEDNTALKLKRRFIVSLCFLVPLMFLCMLGEKVFPQLDYKYNLIIQAVFSIIIIGINFKFYTSGARAIKNLSPNMDTLVSLGSFSAFVYSVVVMISLFFGKENCDHVFFESSAMVLALVTLGKWLEELSKRKTGEEIEKLTKMIPDTVKVIVDGKEKTIKTAELKTGDTVVLRAGDFSPIDGIVIEGFSGVDKSAITGESLPEEVTVGGSVSSGSVVKTGYLHVKAEKVGGETLFSKIVEIVKTAGASKAPVQKFADKVSAVFVPTVTTIAVITFIIWMITGTTYEAFKYAISVLVVSCPCALGLATPVAVMAVTAKAATLGVLYKNAECIQKITDVNCVLLDKTATITEGKPKVVDFINYSKKSDDEIFKIVSAMEKESNHPLKNAIIDYCGDSEKTVEDFSYIIGKGIVAKVDGEKYCLGNFRKIENDALTGKTVVSLLSEEDILAVFAIADTLKADSKEAINGLNGMHITTVMITGDNGSSAKAIASETGISEYCAEVLPEGKAEETTKYKSKGYVTAFVGDGINDSPALKTADVGIAIGTGTDIAIESADVILVNGNLGSLVDAIKLGKKATGIIKGNLFWAFFYNVLFIPVAAGVFTFCGFTFTPTWASACMCASSLFVVLNALRIRLYKSKRQVNGSETQKVLTVKIGGMMCEHCKKKVTNALYGIDKIDSVNVDLKKKCAYIIGEASIEEIKQAIESIGYKYKGIKKQKNK